MTEGYVLLSGAIRKLIQPAFVIALLALPCACAQRNDASGQAHSSPATVLKSPSLIKVKNPRPQLQENIYLEPATDSWSFEPPRDTFSDAALLDLTHLNTPIKSEQQRIILSQDKNDFTLRSGENIRFWAVNLGMRLKSAEQIEQQVRFLVKRGVNMVRLHAFVNPKNPNEKLTQPDQKVIDTVHLYVATLKKYGVYVTLSPYWATSFKAKSSKPSAQSWPIPRNPGAENFNGLLFFDPILQEAYKNWVTELLSQVNPHTGLALKDDPALAVFQLQNEDSLLFWTFESIKQGDLLLLNQMYGRWLLANYGTYQAVQERWDNTQAQGNSARDDWQNGIVQFVPLWQFSKPVPESGLAARMADQLAFLVATMRQFNASMVDHIKTTVGSEVLINAGNWRSSNARYLDDLERFSYSVADVQALNRYVSAYHTGKHANWAIVDGQKYIDASVLTDPMALPLAVKQPRGAPFFITESGWIPPISFQAEGPFLVSLYQSLNGVDGFFWFSAGDIQWRQPASANGFMPSLGKWVMQGPMVLGQFPAAALAYRKNLIAPGDITLTDYRPLKDMIQRTEPRIFERHGFDPNRDQQWLEQAEHQDALALLMGRVEVVFDAAPPATQKQSATPGALTTRGFIANNEQIEWDVKSGIVAIDAPAAQGSCGFQFGSATHTQHARIEIENPYGCVWLVALDDLPLNQSKQILVQMGTRQFASQWQTQPVTWTERERTLHGRQIVEYGKAPWRIENLSGRVKLNNRELTQLTELNSNGEPMTTRSVTGEDGFIEFTLPKTALYAILR